MARDVLWYKGDFCRGKAHGTGVVKFKEPLIARRASLAIRPRSIPLPSIVRGAGNGPGHVATGLPVDRCPPSPTSLSWSESKEEDEEEAGREVLVGRGAVEIPPLALSGTTDEEEDEEEDSSDSEEEEDEENDAPGEGANGAGGHGLGRGVRRHAISSSALSTSGEEKTAVSVGNG